MTVLGCQLNAAHDFIASCQSLKLLADCDVTLLVEQVGKMLKGPWHV